MLLLVIRKISQVFERKIKAQRFLKNYVLKKAFFGSEIREKKGNDRRFFVNSLHVG